MECRCTGSRKTSSTTSTTRTTPTNTNERSNVCASGRAAARQLLGPGLRRQGQHPHQGPEPIYFVRLCWREARPTHHQVPTSGASWRRTRSPASLVRQERVKQGKLRDRGDNAPRQDGAHRGTGLGGLRGSDEEDKKAIAAAAFGRKSGNAQEGAPRGGAPYELLNGQWCSKGMCHFTYDKVNSGGPCYREQRWSEPVPDKVLSSKQQVEHIKNARENNAKRLQVAHLLICSAISAGHASRRSSHRRQRHR
eukprot:2825985-Pleurochrysis_carterae.AAC.1